MTGRLERLLVLGEEVALATGPARARMAAALGAQAARTRRTPLAWGSLYAALAVALSAALVDRPLALWMKAHVHGNIEGFFALVTTLDLAGLWLLPAGLAALAAGLAARRALLPERRLLWSGRAWRAFYLFAAVATAGLSADLVKLMVGRMRPRLLFDQGLYGIHPFSGIWAWNSFPSGHSAAIWGAMTALLVLVPRYDLMWLALAVLVTASRVALTAHFLGDVLAGGWVGVVAALLVARLLRRKGIGV